MQPTSGVAEPAHGGAHTYVGAVQWEYRPELDRSADPGEIVWAWVAFEEDAAIGKDRPIAVVGRTTDKRLAAVMLSSQDRTGHRSWVPIGSGSWDRERRPSFVRIDRVLAVSMHSVRREGAIIPPHVFERIVVEMGGSLTPKRPSIPRRIVGKAMGLFRRR